MPEYSSSSEYWTARRAWENNPKSPRLEPTLDDLVRVMAKEIQREIPKAIVHRYFPAWKQRMGEIITTGEGMPENSEPYRSMKIAFTGIEHPLGRLSGRLFAGVTAPGTNQVVTENGKTTVVSDILSQPEYVDSLREGVRGPGDRYNISKPFDFAQLAAEQTISNLEKILGEAVLKTMKNSSRG